MDTNVVPIKPKEASITERFRAFWKKATDTQKAEITAIVNGLDGKRSNIKTLNQEAREILAFLNKKTGRRYRPIDVNIVKIRSRLVSGVSVEDIKAVIAKKVRDWRDDEYYSKYMRPKTLFDKENFENYLGELEE